MRHVARLVMPFADAALDERRLHSAAEVCIGSGDVVLAPGNVANGDGTDEGRGQGDEGGKGAARLTEKAGVGADRDHRRNQHGAASDRIDVVEVGPLELDIRGADAKWFENNRSATSAPIQAITTLE